MASIKFWNGSAWVHPNVKLHNGTSWTDPEMKYYSGSVWVSLESRGALVVNARADGRINGNLNPPDSSCYVGCAFYNTGAEYEISSTGGLTNATTWLGSGTPGSVWVEFVRTGGSMSAWDTYANSTRYNLGTSRTFEFQDYQVGGLNYIQGYFRFWDAASGGNILQTCATSYWEAWNEGDVCPECCFTPETLVLLGDNTEVPISSIRVGDKIMSANPDTFEQFEQTVTGVITRTNRVMYQLTFDDDTFVDASEDHPFHVKDVGPASIAKHHHEYKGIPTRCQLLEGDLVVDRSGSYKRLVDIARIDYPDTVYTLENTPFFANGLLVY